jgi:hypothetical protein
MLVERYWTSVARTLQIEAAGMNGLVPHQAERGRANELTLAQLLENLLPPTIGVGSGVIIDSAGRTSRQTDIILFNKDNQPQLIAQSLQLLFPVEVVYGAIEVKSRLTADDVTDIGLKAKQLRDLRPTDPAEKPFLGVFAYDFGDSDIARAEELVALHDEEAPDLVCVISPGFILERGVGHGFVPLHAKDESGHPIGGTWDDPEGKPSVLRDGIEHPAFSLVKYARATSHVGDPGRALLLFASALLARLAPISENSSWITNYLSDTAGELLWL